MMPKASQRVPKGYQLDTIFGCFGPPSGNVKTMVSCKRNYRFHISPRAPNGLKMVPLDTPLPTLWRPKSPKCLPNSMSEKGRQKVQHPTKKWSLLGPIFVNKCPQIDAWIDAEQIMKKNHEFFCDSGGAIEGNVCELAESYTKL